VTSDENFLSISNLKAQDLERPVMKLLKGILKWTVRVLLVVLIIAFVWGFIAYWMSKNDCQQLTANPTNPMKAILQCDYGVANLTLSEIEKPVPADNQVLLKVRAASLNPVDGHLLRGFFLMRPMVGMRKPKETRFGRDVAGQVEAIGKNVTQFKPGDEVFGLARGACAEYACGTERGLVIKPNNITFEQAGGVGVAGLTALQGLRKGNIRAGQKVLVNGASGGVGTFAVQIAKAIGAEVTAVCSTRNVDLVRSIGADHVIDYTKEDFTKRDQKYDLLFDNVGNHSRSERQRVLTPNGVCVLAGVGGAGMHPESLGRVAGNLAAALFSKFGGQKFVTFIAQTNKDDLAFLRELMQSGKVSPIIDRTYKMSETQAAVRYLEEGHARGKVVITID